MNGKYINYEKIEVPPAADVPPEQLSAVFRRAALIEYCAESDDPASVTQHQIAEHFGVDQSTISHDMRAIADAHDLHERTELWLSRQARDRQDADEEAEAPEVSA